MLPFSLDKDIINSPEHAWVLDLHDLIFTGSDSAGAGFVISEPMNMIFPSSAG